ncbi:hypothetical protein O988_03540 [Pseudogymnoascus sp. VKM F-3808]|nr:hypothetical protein O988_03540 [Pseudogymnoascus sp. VKM F-3808]KFY48731.1 hypothetical protein V495_01082 [Pseudogymnoascus sp. VKM F-4514 (FW-929)]KFY56227.1 hypothetical protein V497_06442 [Pseudogymnoascus sp. VKM F-4516 (FW-969)]
MKFTLTLLLLLPSAALSCNPGQYYCGNRTEWCNGGQAIAVCSGNNQYQLSSCCGAGGCKYINDLPYCV